MSDEEILKKLRDLQATFERGVDLGRQQYYNTEERVTTIEVAIRGLFEVLLEGIKEDDLK